MLSKCWDQLSQYIILIEEFQQMFTDFEVNTKILFQKLNCLLHKLSALTKGKFITLSHKNI